jgi:hypothetical protein
VTWQREGKVSHGSNFRQVYHARTIHAELERAPETGRVRRCHDNVNPGLETPGRNEHAGNDIRVWTRSDDLIPERSSWVASENGQVDRCIRGFNELESGTMLHYLFSSYLIERRDEDCRYSQCRDRIGDQELELGIALVCARRRPTSRILFGPVSLRDTMVSDLRINRRLNCESHQAPLSTRWCIPAPSCGIADTATGRVASTAS